MESDYLLQVIQQKWSRSCSNKNLWGECLH